MKFIHTVGAVGLSGGLAAYILVLVSSSDGAATVDYASLRNSLAFVSKWLLVPSMMITITSGLVAVIVNDKYIDAPWVWVKALTGLIFFEATLASIDAPAQQAAVAMAQAVAGEIDAETLARLVRNEWGAWWLLLGLSILNVALGIWRPKFKKSPKT
ncbi:MAG: hypothetical protein AB8G18_18150 [Gammaproteobacteria bacterium]